MDPSSCPAIILHFPKPFIHSLYWKEILLYLFFASQTFNPSLSWWPCFLYLRKWKQSEENFHKLPQPHLPTYQHLGSQTLPSLLFFWMSSPHSLQRPASPLPPPCLLSQGQRYSHSPLSPTSWISLSFSWYPISKLSSLKQEQKLFWSSFSF